MGRRIDVYDYYANVSWGAGTWTDIYYWGRGYLTVRVSEYQSEVVKIYSPNTTFHYLDVAFRAWGGRIEALPWSSKIDIYGLAWTWVKLNSSASGGNHNVTVSSPGTNEVWTGNGNDIVTVKTGGRYTYIDTGNGWDVVNLGDGIDAYVVKNNGSLSLNYSPYRSGFTQVRANHVNELYVRARSYTVDVSANGIWQYAESDIYGLQNVKWWGQNSSSTQILKLASPGYVEVWTGWGNDDLSINMGGRYTYVNVGDGNDTVRLTSGIDTIISKGNGILNVTGSLYRTGYTTIDTGDLTELYIGSESLNFKLKSKSIRDYAKINAVGLDYTRLEMGGGTGKLDLYVSSAGRNEIWANNGNNYVNVNAGGRYTFIDFQNGQDSLTLNTGIDVLLYKGSGGSLNLSLYQYLSGTFKLYAQTTDITIQKNQNIRAYGVDVSIENKSELQISRAINYYALGWANFKIITENSRITTNAFCGTTGNGYFKGNNFVRLHSLIETNIDDYGGVNNYVVGSQYGSLDIKNKINLYSTGVYLIDLLGQFNQINNQSKTGNVFVANNGGLVENLQFFQGANGLYYSEHGANISEKSIKIGSYGYGKNIVINNSLLKNTFDIAGGYNVVVDISATANPVYIKNDINQKNDYLVLGSGFFDYKNSINSNFVFISNLSNGAFIKPGLNSSFIVKIQNISFLTGSKISVLFYQEKNYTKYIVYCNDNFIGETNFLEWLPSKIILDFGIHGSFSFDCKVQSFRMPFEINGNTSTIFFFKANNYINKKPVCIDKDLWGNGIQKILMDIINAKSILYLNDQHGVSQAWKKSVELLYSEKLESNIDLSSLTIEQNIAISYNVNVSEFYKSFSRFHIEKLQNSFFEYVPIQFYQANSEEISQNKNILSNLFFINQDQAKHIPYLTSVCIVTNKYLFNQFNKKTQDQLLENIAIKINISNFIDLGDAFTLFPKELFEHLSIDKLKYLKSIKNSWINYDLEKEKYLETALEQKQEEAELNFGKDGFLFMVSQYKYIPHNILESPYFNPDVNNNYQQLLSLSIQSSRIPTWEYLYNIAGFERRFYQGWASQLEIKLINSGLSDKINSLSSLLVGLDTNSEQYKSIKQAIDVATNSINDLKSTIKQYMDLKSTLLTVRLYASVIRMIGATFVLGTLADASKNDSNEIGRFSLSLLQGVAASLQTPVTYFTESIFHKNPNGSISIASTSEFLEYWQKKGLPQSLKEAASIKIGINEGKIRKSLIVSINASARNLEKIKNEIGNFSDFPINSLISEQTTRGNKLQIARAAIPVVMMELTSALLISVAIWNVVTIGNQIVKKIQSGSLSEQEAATLSLRIIQQTVAAAQGTAAAVGNFVQLYRVLASTGHLPIVSAKTLAAIEGGGLMGAAILGLVVTAIDSIVQLSQITQYNVFVPILGFIQDVMFIVADIIAIALPFTLPAILAFQLIMPNLQSVGFLAIMVDQVNLLDSVGKILGVNVSISWDDTMGYIEGCQIFKTLYILLKAQMDQAIGAAMPLGFIFGPIAMAAATTNVKNKVYYEPDYTDGPSVFTTAGFNFLKTLMAERILYDYLIQGVKLLPGGSGLIDWEKFNQSGKQAVSQNITQLQNLYKQGIQFFLNISLSQNIQYPNGSSFGTEAYLILSDIGPYSNFIPLQAPTHKYHSAWKIDSTPVDLSYAYIQMTSIDEKLITNQINALSFGLQGQSINILVSQHISLNIYFVADINNSKNKTEKLTILDGLVAISITNESAQQNMVLFSGAGFNTLSGAREMYGNNSGGITQFLISRWTTLVSGSESSQDSLGVMKEIKLQKLSFTENSIQGLEQAAKFSFNTIVYNISNYFISSPTEVADIRSYFQPLTTLTISKAASVINVFAAVHPYVLVGAQVTNGLWLNIQSRLAEVSLNSGGNVAIASNPNAPVFWKDISIPNGNFEQGYTAWTSDYQRGVLTGSGSEIIAENSPESWNLGSPRGHGGTGSFLLVDGARQSSLAFWRSTVKNLNQQESAYQFCYWSIGANLSPAKIQLFVNGAPVGSHSTAVTDSGWIKNTVSFVARPVNGELFLELKDLNTEPIGNDLGIDDITLKEAELISSGIQPRSNRSSASILNGSFEGKKADFYSDYRFDGSWGSGAASIVKAAPNWGLGVDKAHSGENFLMVDGKAGATVWGTTLSGLDPKATYLLSFYMMGSDLNPAKLKLNVNDIILDSTATTTKNDGWKKQQFRFTPDKNGNASIRIFNTQGESAGNDFGLDSISLSQEITNLSELSLVLDPIKNLIQNGDFDNKDFGSDLTVVDRFYSYGQAQLMVNSPSGWGLSATSGIGNSQFLMVDGGNNPNAQVWYQTIKVKPETRYDFSYYAMGNEPNPAKLQVKLGGVNIGSVNTLSFLEGWKEYRVSFVTQSSQKSVALSISNLETSWNGNDFGLDKITLFESPDQTKSENYFANGDFSNGFDFWDMLAISKITGEMYLTDNAEAYCGFSVLTSSDNSKFLIGKYSSNVEKTLLQQKVNLLEEADYRFSCDVISGLTTSTNIGLWVDGKAIGQTISLSKQAGWEQFTLDLPSLSKGTHTFEIKTLKSTQAGSGFVGFDNFGLMKSSSSVVLSGVEANQLDGFDAQTDCVFILRSKISVNIEENDKDELNTLANNIPTAHSVLIDGPWQALASQKYNNQFNLSISDLLRLDKPAEIYLSSEKNTSLNQIRILSSSITESKYFDLDLSSLFMEHRYGAHPSLKVVGNHPLQLDQGSTAIYIGAHHVLDIYQVKGSDATYGIYYDNSLVFGG